MISKGFDFILALIYLARSSNMSWSLSLSNSEADYFYPKRERDRTMELSEEISKKPHARSYHHVVTYEA